MITAKQERIIDRWTFDRGCYPDYKDDGTVSFIIRGGMLVETDGENVRVCQISYGYDENVRHTTFNEYFGVNNCD